jgi:hypothetical protein
MLIHVELKGFTDLHGYVKKITLSSYTKTSKIANMARV